jgi:hypothetical protein
LYRDWAYDSISLLQEFIDVLQGKGWIDGWWCIVALEKLVEDRCKVGHSCVRRNGMGKGKGGRL